VKALESPEFLQLAIFFEDVPLQQIGQTLAFRIEVESV
jgi:hypothetical protein